METENASPKSNFITLLLLFSTRNFDFIVCVFLIFGRFSNFFHFLEFT